MIAWDSPEWGREGHNVTESETGSWLERSEIADNPISEGLSPWRMQGNTAENGTSDGQKQPLGARTDHG